MKKIGIVFGTRPEAIKIYSIIKECEIRKLEYFIVHTGQHYDENMITIFLDTLNIKPNYKLQHTAQNFGKIIRDCIGVFDYEKPDMVLIQGDTDSALAGGLAGISYGCKIGHIESGLRSGDMRMPEEKNRIILDHLSDYLFCPTYIQYENCMKENILQEKLYITGNTVLDCLNDFKCERINDGYIYLTLHRPGNVDDINKLDKILGCIDDFADEYEMDIIFSCHPRTRYNIKGVYKNIKIIKPVGYKENIKLINNSDCVFTDSGGIQEEASALGVPCLIFRPNTERVESIMFSQARLFDTDIEFDSDVLISEYEILVDEFENKDGIYGDGEAGKKILDIILK